MTHALSVPSIKCAAVLCVGIKGPRSANCVTYLTPTPRELNFMAMHVRALAFAKAGIPTGLHAQRGERLG
jgi:hypothetical protein